MNENKTRIIRIKKEKGYTIISNDILSRNDLSWKAKGILTYILSLPDDWVIYLDEIAKHSTDGIKSFRSGWKELETVGYVKRIPIRDKGKIVEWQTFVSEDADLTAFLPLSHFVHVENVDVENGILQSTYCTKDLSLQKTKNQSRKPDSVFFRDVINYLNEVAESSFEVSKDIENLITKRWQEGHRLDDFERVIDNMTYEWSQSEELNSYIQPVVLFGTNFNKYLKRKGSSQQAF